MTFGLVLLGSVGCQGSVRADVTVEASVAVSEPPTCGDELDLAIPCEAWVRRDGVPLEETPRDMIARDGAVYVLVEQAMLGNFYIEKIDARSGSVLWRLEYDDPAGARSWGHAVALDVAGDVLYVAGAVEQPSQIVYPGSRALTLAVSTLDGSVRWTAEYSSPEGERAVGRAVSVDPVSGWVVVTGFQWTNPSFGTYTVAMNPGNGAQEWVSATESVEGTNALANRVFPGGIMLEQSWDRVSAIRVDSGERLWTRDVVASDRPRIGASGDGSMAYFAGGAPGNTSYMAVQAIHSDGADAWMTTLPDPLPFWHLPKFGMSADGSKLFALGATGLDLMVYGVDAATGTIDWTTRVEAPTPFRSEADYVVGQAAPVAAVYEEKMDEVPPFDFSPVAEPLGPVADDVAAAKNTTQEAVLGLLAPIVFPFETPPISTGPVEVGPTSGSIELPAGFAEEWINKYVKFAHDNVEYYFDLVDYYVHVEYLDETFGAWEPFLDEAVDFLGDWRYETGPRDRLEHFDMAVAADGTIILSGLQFPPTGFRTLTTIALDSTGENRWTTRFQSPGNSEELDRVVIDDASGMAILAGRANREELPHDSWIAAYEIDGPRAAPRQVEVSCQVETPSLSTSGCAWQAD